MENYVIMTCDIIGLEDSKRTSSTMMAGDMCYNLEILELINKKNIVLV